MPNCYHGRYSGGAELIRRSRPAENACSARSLASARAVEAEKVGPGGSLPISFIVQERLPRRFGIGGTRRSTAPGSRHLAASQPVRARGAPALRCANCRHRPDPAGRADPSYRHQSREAAFTLTPPSLRRFGPANIPISTPAQVAAEATHIVNKQLSGRLRSDGARQIRGRSAREFFSAGLVGAITHDSRDNAADATKGHLLE